MIEVVAGDASAELEVWAAGRRSDLLARLLERPVTVRLRGTRAERALARNAR